MKQSRPRWMRLDNAGKIYPAARRRKWSNVYRLAVTLRDAVDPAVLQSALEATVPRFPSIAARVRSGMFWYYIESLPSAPEVMPDGPYPCSRFQFRDIKKCAFRVLYYENRIAVEFFHALTDGTGGMSFLKTLTAEYILQKYGVRAPNEDDILDRNEEPKNEELEDSFLKYEGPVTSSRREKTAYRLPGTEEPDGFLNITTGILEVADIQEKAREYKVSLSAYLAAVMMEAILSIQNEHVPRRKRQKPVKVLVPVNLRSFFESDSLRNFALYITPEIDPRMGEYTFEEIVKSVYHQMGAELTQKQMNAKLTANVRAEKVFILKIMPLFVKDFAMKMTYNMVGERKSCLCLSNLGVVTLPEEIRPFVTRFDVVLGAQASRPYNCGIISYNGKMYINFIRNTREPDLERGFFTGLRKKGIHVLIESNQRS